MHLSPFIALVAWIPISLIVFWRYPSRIAILVNFLGGWAVLPGANFPPSSDPFPYWILGVCLPTDYLITKATIVGFAGLLGVLAFDFPSLHRFRPTWIDLPMAVWCLVPLLSAATHPATMQQGLFGCVYQTLAWGGPWLLGRIYFAETASLLLATQAALVAALLYVPICLLEFLKGPHLYALLYGYEPYRLVGADRYIGFRPIGLMEDGNQLGIWMAAATLIAVSFALHRILPRILGIPMAGVAVILAVTTVLCQSIGSILILILLLPITLFQRRFVLRFTVAALILGIVAFAAIRMMGVVSLRAVAEHNRVAHALASGLKDIGRQSFGWRLARDEGHVHTALEHPLLGSGLWYWWQNGNARPWSLWLLVLGMYGVVGLAAFGSILFLPVIRATWSATREQDPRIAHLRLTLAALILMVALDNLLNGAMILPYLLIVAGLSAHRPALRETPQAPEILSPLPA
jgi:hypothetical protein